MNEIIEGLKKQIDDLEPSSITGTVYGDGIAAPRVVIKITGRPKVKYVTATLETLNGWKLERPVMLDQKGYPPWEVNHELTSDGDVRTFKRMVLGSMPPRYLELYPEGD